LHKKLLIIGTYPIDYNKINWINYEEIWGVASCLFIDELKNNLTKIFERIY
jgi:hypothetical protein